MRKGDQGRARSGFHFSKYHPLNVLSLHGIPWEAILTHFLTKKSVAKLLKCRHIWCCSWGIKVFDIPIFSSHKERKSHKIHRKCCPSWVRLLWYLVYNFRFLKAHRNVSYHKTKLAGLKFSSVPKQLVFLFPSVLLFLMGFFCPLELNLRLYKTRQQPCMRWFLFYLDT